MVAVLTVSTAALGVLDLARVSGVGTESPSHGSLSGSSALTPIRFNSTWVVNNWQNISGGAITAAAGLLIGPGGHLSLTDSTLVMLEPSNLAYGVVIERGGSLTTNGLALAPAPIADHTYLWAQNGSTLHVVGGEFDGIGGPVPTEQGVYIETPGATITGTTFDWYYQAIVVANAPGVRVSNATILNSTAGSNATYAVQVFGSSSGFALTGSTVRIPQDVGALWVGAPYAQIAHDTFTLDPAGSARSALLFGYAANGLERADHSAFTNNSVTGSGFIDEAGSYVVIWGNTIRDTGPERPYGLLVEVPDWTEKGLWATAISIQWNTISDYSRYGIRLQQNVSGFIVAHNAIVQPSASPGPAWTEIWGGPQTDALYLIRGVADGTVRDNYIDDSDVGYVATDGITLESDVSHVSVVGNEFFNVSQEGVVLQGNVPGFDNALPWQCGPSVDDTITNNLFDNLRPVTETNFTVEAILLWQWANRTIVENNTFIGWQNVPTEDYFNGAIVLTTGSYGLFWNNTVEGARYGFVFGNFTGLAHPYVGEFNRSENLVYGNHLSGITVSPVDETPSDGMGPLHNVIVALSTAGTAAGLPLTYVESILTPSSLAITGASGVYSETLRTVDPLTGTLANFTSRIGWGDSEFSLEEVGGLASGANPFTLDALSASSLQFTSVQEAPTACTADLYPTPAPYQGVYQLTQTVNGGTSSSTVSTDGPLNFGLAAGSATVAVQLLSWTPLSLPDHNLSGTVRSAITGLPIRAAVVSVARGPTSITDSLGRYHLSLPPGTYSVTASAGGFVARTVVVAVGGLNAVTSFRLPRAVYTVGFHEEGLSSQAWRVRLGEVVRSTDASGGWIVFREPNGSFGFTIVPPSGFLANPAGGTVPVTDGNPAAILVVFSPISIPIAPGVRSAVPGVRLLPTGPLQLPSPPSLDAWVPPSLGSFRPLPDLGSPHPP